MDAEDRKHLESLRQSYQQRLRKLEQQAARRGTATPPEVEIELEDLQQRLADVDIRLGQGAPTVAASGRSAAPLESAQLGPLLIDQVHEEKIDAVIAELRHVHDLYRTMLPPSDLLPRLYKLFRRNAFQERVRDCFTEDWVSRIRAVVLTNKVLRAYSPSISRFGTTDQDTWHTDLVGAVEGYVQNLPGLFMHKFSLTLIDTYLYDVEALAQHLPESLPKSRVDPRVISNCDERLNAISHLWQRMGYPALLADDTSHTPAG